MKPKKLTRDQIQSTIKNAITEAVAFVEGEIAPARIKAQKYFDGRVDLPVEDGRSKVVATKCRDTLRAVKPALMRVFLQSGRPVEFVPRKPQAVQEAEQKTNYAAYVFERNNGFQILSDAIDDALKKKVGIWKVYADEPATVEIDEYSDLMEDQVQLLRMDPEIDILEEEVTQEATIDETGMTIMPAMYRMKVAKESRTKEIRIDAVSPEDFFIDRNASYTIVVGATVSSGSHVIRVASASDVIQGAVSVATDIAGVTCPTAVDSDTITMNGSTTGGVRGSLIEVQDIASGIWSVRGSLVSTGTEATPFSAAV